MKLPSVDCTLCENAFGRYCVPKSSQHRPAPQEVLSGRVWELATIEFMRRHALDKDIVHAGMFFGDFLPGLASSLAPGRKIYGFEPNPENFHCAQWTAVLNNIDSVIMYNAGLGEAKGGAFMTMFANGTALGGGSRIIGSYREDANISAEVSPIDIVTIDDTVPTDANIGIIQLDVEGYETFALLGGINTIRKHLPIIIVESVPNDFVKEYLGPIGYRQNGTVCDNTIFTT